MPDSARNARRPNIPRRGKQASQESPARERAIVGLIWDAVREQTLIQLIQKVILSPLKAGSPARPGRPKRNHKRRREERKRQKESERERERERKGRK